MPYDPQRHGPRRIVGPGFHRRVYRVVSNIPEGWVASYGDVAGALGLRAAARQVGYALAAIPEDQADLPWHRVVNAKGEISGRRVEGASASQEERLRAEGIEVDDRGRLPDFETIRFVFDTGSDG